MDQDYLEAIKLIERLHRQFLEVVKVELDRKVRYELDCGDRSKVKSFEVEVEAGALSVCVPRRDGEGN